MQGLSQNPNALSANGSFGVQPHPHLNREEINDDLFGVTLIFKFCLPAQPEIWAMVYLLTWFRTNSSCGHCMATSFEN